MPHGYGFMKYKNGNKYKGEWNDEDRDGFGKIYNAETGKWTIYQFEDNNIKKIVKGEDEIMLDCGSKYVGHLENAQPHGFGIMSSDNGEHYEGEWKDGKQDGKGIYTNSEGDKYDGEWFNG